MFNTRPFIKCFLPVVFLLSITCVNAQQAQGGKSKGKKETIDWIASTINNQKGYSEQSTINTSTVTYSYLNRVKPKKDSITVEKKIRTFDPAKGKTDTVANWYTIALNDIGSAQTASRYKNIIVLIPVRRGLIKYKTTLSSTPANPIAQISLVFDPMSGDSLITSLKKHFLLLAQFNKNK